MSDITWDDLNSFAKDALAYANLNGYVVALDDDEDDEDKEFAGWAKWVIWGLTKQGLLSPHDSKNGLSLITPAGRALVASADAPAGDQSHLPQTTLEDFSMSAVLLERLQAADELAKTLKSILGDANANLRKGDILDASSTLEKWEKQS